MDTYLVNRGGVHRVARSMLADSDEEAVEHWRIEGGEALFQRRHSLATITGPREIVFYTTCHQCTPVLVRRDHATVWGDLIDERQLWVEFRATVIPGEPPRIERTSGTRADLIAELREEGIRVMRDDEPLAVAHQELRAARAESSGARRSRRR
jgi:hypothetical protein